MQQRATAESYPDDDIGLRPPAPSDRLLHSSSAHSRVHLLLRCAEWSGGSLWDWPRGCSLRIPRSRAFVCLFLWAPCTASAPVPVCVFDASPPSICVCDRLWTIDCSTDWTTTARSSTATCR